MGESGFDFFLKTEKKSAFLKRFYYVCNDRLTRFSTEHLGLFSTVLVDDIKGVRWGTETFQKNRLPHKHWRKVVHSYTEMFTQYKRETTPD